MRTAWTVGLFCAVSGGASCLAQSPWFLAPSQFRARPGAAVKIQIVDPDAPKAGPRRPPPPVRWAFVRSEGSQHNYNNMFGGGGEPVPPLSRGVNVVGIDFAEETITVSPDEFHRLFRKFGAQDGGQEPRPPRQNIKVRLLRSARTIIRIGEGDGPVIGSAVATSETGQGAEVLLLADPSAIVVGSDLPIGAAVNGEEAGGAKLLISRAGGGPRQMVETSHEGMAHVFISDPGKWQISFGWLEKEEDEDIPWELRLASLTFEVGGGK